MKIIIVGNGKVGYAIARQLSSEGHDLTIVDKTPDNLANADSTLDVYTLSYLARMRTEDVLLDLKELEKRGYLQSK